MKHHRPYEVFITILAVTGDVLLVNTAAVCSFLIRFDGALPVFNFSAYLNLAPFMAALFCLLNYIFELYEFEKKFRRGQVINQVLQSVSLGFVVLVAFSFFYRQFSFPRMVLGFFYGLNLLTSLLWHLFLHELNLYLRFVFVDSRQKTRVLLVGGGPAGQKLAAEIHRHAAHKVNLVGYLDDDPYADISTPSMHHCGEFRALPIVIREKDVQEVIFCLPARPQEKMMECLELCLDVDIKFKVVPELLDVVMHRDRFDMEYGTPLVNLTVEPVIGWRANLKRLVDVICSMVGLIFLALMIPFVLLGNFFFSRGPLFYTQTRLGKNVEPFELIKLRTMIPDAEDKTGPVWAGRNDARITLFGSFLRKTKLDELPQVINILRGEMSVVGPRPERPEFAKPFLKTIPFYQNRFLVAPGLTGWAQINQESDTTIDDVKKKLKYDLHYIEYMSIGFDVEIILKTLPRVLKTILAGNGKG